MNHSAFVLALSIAALASAVKAQEGNLPSFKKAGARHETGFKDSVKDVRNDFSKLIQILLVSGEDIDFPDGFAQAVGLSQPMPAKHVEIVINHHEDTQDVHTCHVVYVPDGNAGKHAVCVLLSRVKDAKGWRSSTFYRVNLGGQLESAVVLHNKLGSDGNALPEGRSRSEEDKNSPATQRAFKTEMTYWLKDWLKKQHPVKTATAKLTVPEVKEHAAAEHQATDQDAAAAAASGAAPTTP